MKKQIQKGFTLIELMIVVAIIGILASIALPAYQTYVAKSNITSIVASAAAGKTAVWSAYVEGGQMLDTGAGAGGFQEANTSTRALFDTLNGLNITSRVVYQKTSDTEARLNVTIDNVNGNINGNVIGFIFQDDGGQLVFNCDASAGPIENKYLPKQCQS